MNCYLFNFYDSFIRKVLLFLFKRWGNRVYGEVNGIFEILILMR